jgi:pimeloyl-ACP methyl ester carboxylesterase/Flp pilus assembly protein TadB
MSRNDEWEMVPAPTDKLVYLNSFWVRCFSGISKYPYLPAEKLKDKRWDFLQQLHSFEIYDSATNGRVCILKKDNVVFVTFRGTQKTSVSNIKTDIDIVKTDFGKDCYVHRGFYTAYQALHSELSSYIKKIIKHNNTGRPLVWLFVGHSLGGALANIAAAVWSKVLQPSLITFGAPAVGDQNFAAFLNQVSLRHIRFAQTFDPVVWLLSIVGFQHAGVAVTVPSDQGYHVMNSYMAGARSCWFELGARKVSRVRRSVTDPFYPFWPQGKIIVASGLNKVLLSKKELYLLFLKQLCLQKAYLKRNACCKKLRLIVERYTRKQKISVLKRLVLHEKLSLSKQQIISSYTDCAKKTYQEPVRHDFLISLFATMFVVMVFSLLGVNVGLLQGIGLLILCYVGCHQWLNSRVIVSQNEWLRQKMTSCEGFINGLQNIKLEFNNLVDNFSGDEKLALAGKLTNFFDKRFESFAKNRLCQGAVFAHWFLVAIFFMLCGVIIAELLSMVVSVSLALYVCCVFYCLVNIYDQNIQLADIVARSSEFERFDLVVNSAISDLSNDSIQPEHQLGM